MRRLPNVNYLVAQVTQHAIEASDAFEKQASAPAPEYTIPLAQQLQKVAELCRSNAAEITVGDVRTFARRMMRRF